MEQYEPLDFPSVALRQRPVTIAGKKYMLLEASGDASCRYRNAVFQCTRLGPDGKPVGIGSMADCEPLLVSLCLAELDPKGNIHRDARGVPLCVHYNTIRLWPAYIQSELFKAIKELTPSLRDKEDDSETEESLTAKIEELRAKLDVLVEKRLKAQVTNDNGYSDSLHSSSQENTGKQLSPDEGDEEGSLKNSPSSTTAGFG